MGGVIGAGLLVGGAIRVELLVGGATEGRATDGRGY